MKKAKEILVAALISLQNEEKRIRKVLEFEAYTDETKFAVSEIHRQQGEIEAAIVVISEHECELLKN
jgi:hypothetical protein